MLLIITAKVTIVLIAGGPTMPEEAWLHRVVFMFPSSHRQQKWSMREKRHNNLHLKPLFLTLASSPSTLVLQAPQRLLLLLL